MVELWWLVLIVNLKEFSVAWEMGLWDGLQDVGLLEGL